MTQEQIRAIVSGQRAFFASAQTLSLKYRREALIRLRDAMIKNEERFAHALASDLGKSDFEAYMCETGLAVSEISYMIKHLGNFSKIQRVRTPSAQFAARSYVQPVPYGVVLIMSPWNYPLLLTIAPLANALAAGNTAVVKPSAYSPATSALVQEILAELYPPEYVSVITGGRAENTYLLDEKFDYIFFTGSKSVGIEVMSRAAKHLTPVTLELGGKSPCIVDETANIRLAARRIVFGKYLNCGQTCVAPDYILCHVSVKDAFVSAVKAEIERQYGTAAMKNADYGKIVNQKHFERIRALMDPQKVVYGGKSDPITQQVEPTVMDGVTRADAVMREEIFGPVMPILTYETLDDVIKDVNAHDKPLALYIFSSDRKHIRRIMKECAFGGGCVNDVVIHLATSNMGFGGVGESGMGAYHGKVGFDTFSHKKASLIKKRGSICPCVTDHTIASVTQGFCTCF